MKKTYGILFFFTFILSIGMQSGISKDHRLEFKNPRDGSCFTVTSSNPYIMVKIVAEFKTGIKQGIIYLRKGRHVFRVGEEALWSRIWGHSYPPGTSSIDEYFRLRMLGRGEGEFTLAAKFTGRLPEGTSPYRTTDFYARSVFTMDYTNPTVIITSPENESVIYFKGNPYIKVKVRANDTGCGIREIKLFLDSMTNQIAAVGGNASEIMVMENMLPAGRHQLYAVAIDKAGNRAATWVTVQIKK